MTPATRTLAHAHDVTPGEISMTRYLATALNLPHHRLAAWGTDRVEIPDLPGVVQRTRASRHSEVLVGRPGLAALINLNDGSAHVRVAGGTIAEVDLLVEELRALLPAGVTDPEAPTVPVTFWSFHPMGVRTRRRTIAVPSWDECRDNYPDSTFEALDPVICDFVPGAAGQLLLWHGEPGTGKTFALRALAWEWRGWCDLHYITDPEVLFGEHASYLLDVLLDDDDHDRPIALQMGGGELDIDAPPQPEPDPRARDGRWRLLVLEDTGEMMSADARERSGQGLGRLLNVVDGLIGQGLRILVLVTTNERIGKLHPAVARAGRCAASIAFAPLPYDEALQWLTERGVDHAALPEDWLNDPPRHITAADLYALAAGSDLERERATVGFTS